MIWSTYRDKVNGAARDSDTGFKHQLVCVHSLEQKWTTRYASLFPYYQLQLILPTSPKTALPWTQQFQRPRISDVFRRISPVLAGSRRYYTPGQTGTDFWAIWSLHRYNFFLQLYFKNFFENSPTSNITHKYMHDVGYLCMQARVGRLLPNSTRSTTNPEWHFHFV